LGFESSSLERGAELINTADAAAKPETCEGGICNRQKGQFVLTQAAYII
jgi:hypothetical protein